MNRQELFNPLLPLEDMKLDNSHLTRLNKRHRFFSDVNFPNFFSGWPYFILILAALTMGNIKALHGMSSTESYPHSAERNNSNVEEPLSRVLSDLISEKSNEKKHCDISLEQTHGNTNIHAGIPDRCLYKN